MEVRGTRARNALHWAEKLMLPILNKVRGIQDDITTKTVEETECAKAISDGCGGGELQCFVRVFGALSACFSASSDSEC